MSANGTATLKRPRRKALMATYTIDLHNHTPLIPTDYRGDPATTPRQIVERALELGIDVWGIADHWSVAYAARLIQAADEVAEQTGVRLLVIPGAEIRIKHLAEETHLVCLFPPERAASAFADLLERLGLSDPVAPFEELPHFAVDCDPLEVAGAVDAIGGICYVGHVDRTFGEYRFIDSELVHQLVECEAVLAIELIDHACRDCFRDGLGIAHISSSDSHALAEMGRRTARLEMPESSFEGLREGLRALRGVAE